MESIYIYWFGLLCSRYQIQHRTTIILWSKNFKQKIKWRQLHVTVNSYKPFDLKIIFIYVIIHLGFIVSRDGFSWPSACVPWFHLANAIGQTLTTQHHLHISKWASGPKNIPGWNNLFIWDQCEVTITVCGHSIWPTV